MILINWSVTNQFLFFICLIYGYIYVVLFTFYEHMYKCVSFEKESLGHTLLWQCFFLFRAFVGTPSSSAYGQNFPFLLQHTMLLKGNFTIFMYLYHCWSTLCEDDVKHMWKNLLNFTCFSFSQVDFHMKFVENSGTHACFTGFSCEKTCEIGTSFSPVFHIIFKYWLVTIIS